MKGNGTKIDEILKSYNYFLLETTEIGRLYVKPNNPAVFIDTQLYELTFETYPYVTYTSYQNKIMYEHQGLYRFLGIDLEELKTELQRFLNFAELDPKLRTFGANRDESHIDPTPPEYNFSLAFEEVFGSKYLHALQAEAIYFDLNGHRRYVDYLLHRKGNSIAIELNGEHYHHPLSEKVTTKAYRSQLFKQNSLVYDGYLVYRWSNRGMQDNFKFEDQLREYFGDSESFNSAPKYKAARRVDFALYKHQVDAVKRLQEQRQQNISTFLVVLPTGTGKTEVFIEDFRIQNDKGVIKQALAIVPSRALKQQLITRVKSQLNNINVGEDMDNPSLDLVVQTSAYVLRHFHHYAADAFDYILVDEAHHAPAHGFRKILEHFTPKTLLGLTATDTRLDQQKLEDIFGSYQTNLTLEEAIQQGLLPQIRAFRLHSNIDFSKVRFNGKEFVKSDLQKTIQIPSRDELILNTILKYFIQDGQQTLSTKQGIIFCVDIKHAKRMAKLLTDNGVSAAAVSGVDREGLIGYQEGTIQYLCACDLLNEGWDAPQTSIVVMARPTLSKVLYTQQLGRGTRKHPEKEALYVIDVVDSYGALLQPWSTHNLFGYDQYIPFSDLIKGAPATLQHELLILDGLFEEERRIEPINIFNFEREYGDLLNEEQLARELFVSTGTVKSWLKKGDIKADKTLPFGSKQLSYFAKGQVESIKTAKNIKDRTEDTRRDDFFEFLEKRDYTFSYKIIFMLILANQCNKEGEIEIEVLAKKYSHFYQSLLTKFGKAEKENNPLNINSNLQDISYIKRSILNNPFEKFERKRFLYQCADLALLSFDSVLWDKLEANDIKKINDQLITDAINYFAKFEINLTPEYIEDLLVIDIGNENTSPDHLEDKAKSNNVIEAAFPPSKNIVEIPYYEDLKIACGHFKTSSYEVINSYPIEDDFGKVSPDKHFVATANGNSMDGGKNPIVDGDLLLLEWISPESAGSISNQTLAIELLDETGDPQYLLRTVRKQPPSTYILKANNPDYCDQIASEHMRTFARFIRILKPNELS